MNHTIPYLHFSGQLEEALTFYRTFLTIETHMLLRFSDSPDPVPEGMLEEGFEQKIMHATISIEGTTIMASDGCNSTDSFSGFSLSVTLPDETEAKRVFGAFAESGEVSMPIGKTFWSPCFGMVTDQFGLNWMVTVPEQEAPSNEEQIETIIEDFAAAICAKDQEKILSYYTEDAICCDIKPPFQLKGKQAINQLWDQCLPYFPEKVEIRQENLKVFADGNVASAHWLQHISGIEEITMRATAIFTRDAEGQWKIAHDHVSCPFDIMTGSVVKTP